MNESEQKDFNRVSMAEKGRKNLNVGCSISKLDNCINMDIDPRVNPDIVGDAEKMPFKANTFDYIHLSSVLEHLDAFKCMKEVYRVANDGCIVEIWVPHWTDGVSTWSHIEHKRGFSYFLFEKGKEKEYGIDFEIVERRILVEGRKYPYQNTDWTRFHHIFTVVEAVANKWPYAYERFLYPFLGGAQALYIKLQIKKGQPGLQLNLTKSHAIGDSLFIKSSLRRSR